MTKVRRLLRKVGVGKFPGWLLVFLAMTWIVIAVAVADTAGQTERIMATRSGMYCYLNPCPPMQIWPTEYVVFHPAFDAGFVGGFLVVALLIVAWRSLGRLALERGATA